MIQEVRQRLQCVGIGEQHRESNTLKRFARHCHWKSTPINNTAISQRQAEVAVEIVMFDPAKPEGMAQYGKMAALIKLPVLHVVIIGRLMAGDM